VKVRHGNMFNQNRISSFSFASTFGDEDAEADGVVLAEKTGTSPPSAATWSIKRTESSRVPTEPY